MSAKIWTQDKIIGSLRAFHDNTGRQPRVSDSRAHGRDVLPSAKVCARAFGSWNAAVEAAGFTPAIPSGGQYRRKKKHTQDLDAVCCVCLADLLQRVVGQAVRQIPFGHREFAGPFAVLSDESGIPRRTLYSILQHRYATVGLKIADELLSALERPDLLYALEVFDRRIGHSPGQPGTHVCSLAAAGLSAGSIDAPENASPPGGGELPVAA